MSATISDVPISNTEYTNINTESGIPTGSDVLISNKSLNYLRIQVSPTQPTTESTDGDLIGTFPLTTYQKVVKNEVDPIWVISNSVNSSSKISVQVI